MKKTVKTLVIITICLALVLSLSIGFTACDKEDATNRDEHFANDMLFKIDDETTVWGLPLSIFSEVLNEDESYFTFTSNGKVHGQLKTKTKQEIFEVIGGLLQLFEINLDDISAQLPNIDLDEMIVKPYVVDMFPGFTLDHVVESFELMKKSLGLSLIGFDLENEQIQGIIAEIEETHRIPADLIDRLPDDFSFGLAFDGTYFLKTVVDADGHSQKAVYVGGDVAHNPSTQPFVIFSMEDEGGRKHLALSVEFIMINIVLYEVL